MTSFYSNMLDNSLPLSFLICEENCDSIDTLLLVIVGSLNSLCSLLALGVISLKSAFKLGDVWKLTLIC